MKKMITPLTLIALALTLSTMAFGQTMKRPKPFRDVVPIWSTYLSTQTMKRNSPGNPARPSNVIDWEGSPIGHLRGHSLKTQETSRREFDRGYLSPYAARGYRGTTTINQGFNKSDTLSGGSGNDASRSARARRRSFEGDPDRPIVIGSAHDKTLIGGLPISGNTAKAGGANDQPTGHNANPQVTQTRRYLEQDGVYKLKANKRN